MGSFRPDIDADSGPIMLVVQLVSLVLFVASVVVAIFGA